MSDSVSSSRQPELAPAVGRDDVRQGGSSIFGFEASQSPSDEPTVISDRPPIPSMAAAEVPRNEPEDLLKAGELVGHFELVEYVGGGGMGRVFRAVDTRLGRTVALKILPPNQATDADALQRFQNEAQSTARLDHDNIVRAYDVGEDRGLHYIAFEFIEGMNIRALVERNGPLPLADAVSYTMQVAEALAHAFDRAVVHRDIKPSNVLVTPQGVVKLIDMGLARLRQTDPAVADLTASGVTLGTFDYISPEQARDPRSADIRSDIYSLGCTVFFMLSGKPPFPEGTVLQKLLQHQGDEPPDIRQLRPDVPEQLSRVLRRMMEKDRGRRYAGPNELIADLMLVANEIGLRPVSPGGRVWIAPRDGRASFLQRHGPWIAAAAFLVFIAALVEIFSSYYNAGPSPPATVNTKPRPLVATSPSVTPLADKRLAGRGTGRQSTSEVSKNSVEAPTKSRPDGTSPPSAVSIAKAGGTGMKTEAFNNSSPLQGRRATNAAGAARPSPPLVVTDNPVEKRQFTSLAAAVAAARHGDTIELRFNDRREERPIAVRNMTLKIRAAEGYRPVVVFRPSDAADPIRHPHSMFTLAGGQLTLGDVAVEFHIPRGVPAESWTLVETEGGQMVKLERCCLTVSNSGPESSYHQDVAFFRARSGADGDEFGSAFAATPLTSIELTDCVARGEADFLRVDDPQPVYLMWDNGLLLTSEHLLAAGGSEFATRPDEMLRIELRHVTAAVQAGLCRLTSTSSSPHQLPVQLVSTRNIWFTGLGIPLVEQEGASSVDDFRQRFVWNGDRNFYQDVGIFWSILGLDPEAPADVMNFERWKDWWGPSRENQPSKERLFWRHTPPAGEPLHNQGPADYTLEDPTFGDDPSGPPGCRVNRLPPVPSTSLSERRNQPAFRAGAAGQGTGDHRRVYFGLHEP